jgi:carbon-monoxide dehydrogenase medium subunit
LKSAPFDYVKPASLQEALELRRRHGADSAILAGGQSLIPDFNQRLRSTATVIDINGLSALSSIEESEDIVSLGATSRYREIAASALIAEHAPLLKMAISEIGSPAIRNRGTIGGSVSMADPGAELPACLCALGANFELARAGSKRMIAAKDFFTGRYETALDNDEILTRVDVPKSRVGFQSAFGEIARRKTGSAMCGVAAHGKVTHQSIQDLKMVFFGIDETPILAVKTISVIECSAINDVTTAELAAALSDDLHPFDDIHCSAKLKMHYATVLTQRVLAQFVSAHGEV